LLLWLGCPIFLTATSTYSLTVGGEITVQGIIQLDAVSIRFARVDATGGRVIIDPITRSFVWREFTPEGLKALFADIQRSDTFLKKSIETRQNIRDGITPWLRTRQFLQTQGDVQPKGKKRIDKSSAPETKNANVLRMQRARRPVPPMRAIPPRPSLTSKTIDVWTGIPDGFLSRGEMDYPAGTIWSAIFSSPIMLFVLLLILGANFYLAREVSHCCRHNTKLVCGLSCIGPYIVPLVFLLINRKRNAVESVVEPTVAEPESVQPNIQDEQPPAGENGLIAYYTHAEVRFNRHFFETELMRFKRMAPSDTEWILVRTKAGKEMWAGRISAVTEESVTFVVATGNVWNDQLVRNFEINEIQIISNQL